MTCSTTTYEFTAFTEADLLQGSNGHSIGRCDSFTMPGSASTCFEVTDNDSFLSGDRYHNEAGDDHSFQTADITVGGDQVFNDVKIYAESYHVLHGSDGKTYYMIEIEVKNGDAPGEGDDFFTFYGAVPPAGTELHVVNTCNVTCNWVDFKCLSAGLKWDLDEECKYTLEAEDMALWGYKAEYNDNASGDELIKLKSHTGVAKADFGGESGAYNISIDYVDENDGEGFIDVFINGEFVDCIALDQNGDGNGVSNTTFSTFTIEGVELNEGDEIKLKGRKGGWEFARIDKIVFEQVKEEEPGALSGRYFCDENNNDIDDGEPGIAGAVVELLDANGNAVLDENGQPITTTTDDQGNYRFDDLAPGDYRVRFAQDTDGKTFVAQDDPDGNGDDTTDSDVDPDTGVTGVVTVNAGEETENVDAGVEDPGTAEIRGRYFCDENDNDIDDGEPGIVGAVVELLDANGNAILDENGQPITTTTDDQGNYAFTGLVAGTYTVRFAPDVDGKTFVAQDDPNGNGDDTTDSDVDPTTGVTGPITLAIGDISEDNDAGVEQLDPGTAALGDTIWLDFFGNGLLDDFEARIDGITVELKDENGNVIDTQVTTNGGQYLFDNLNAGTYSVGIVKPAIGDTVTFIDANGNAEDVTLSEDGIAGFELTTPNAGDDTLDSDFDPVLMMTDQVVLGEGEVNLTLDGGLLRCGLIEGSSQNVGQGNPIFPAAGYDLLVGCETDDVMRGRSGEDTLFGNGGDDRLDGDSFDDVLDGGAGNDDLDGGSENDILIGGAGNDDLNGDGEFDIAVFSGNFADAQINIVNLFTGELSVTSADGVDRVRNIEMLRFDDGDVALDQIVPGGARDEVAAPAGAGASVNIDVLANDVELSEGTLEVAEASNGAFGTATVEADGTVTYTAGSDFAGYDFFSYTVSNGLGFVKTVEVQVGELPRPVAGDPGVIVLDDVLGTDGITFDGSNSADIILGGDGFDRISGQAGEDLIDGGKGDDFIVGNFSDDILLGGEGDDFFNGDNGNDQIFGETGRDLLVGSIQDDIMFGGDGADRLQGQNGSDFLSGGAGDDEFTVFGDGADIAFGGDGDDSFEWSESNGAERDLIDGESGVDTLEIVLDAGANAAAVQLEIDAYFAQVAANTPSGGTISDGSVLSETFSFTTIDLDIRNIEDVLLS